MNATRPVVASVAAVSVVGAIGLAYAQGGSSSGRPANTDTQGQIAPATQPGQMNQPNQMNPSNQTTQPMQPGQMESAMPTVAARPAAR